MFLVNCNCLSASVHCVQILIIIIIIIILLTSIFPPAGFVLVGPKNNNNNNIALLICSLALVVAYAWGLGQTNNRPISNFLLFYSVSLIVNTDLLPFKLSQFFVTGFSRCMDI